MNKKQQNDKEAVEIMPFIPQINNDIDQSAQALLSNDTSQSKKNVNDRRSTIDPELDELQKTFDQIGLTEKKVNNKIEPFQQKQEAIGGGNLLNQIQNQFQQNIQVNSDKKAIKDQISKLQSILAEKLRAQLAEQEIRKSQELLKQTNVKNIFNVDEQKQKEEDQKTFEVQQEAMQLLNDLVKKQPNRQQLNSFLPQYFNQDEDAVVRQPNLSYIKRKEQPGGNPEEDEEQKKIEEENRMVEEENLKWNELSDKDKWDNLQKLNVKEQNIRFGIPIVEDIKKVLNYDSVLQENFFEKLKPLDESQLKSVFYDCIEYRDEVHIFAKYYFQYEGDNYITFVQKYIKKYAHTEITKTKQFMFLNQVYNRNNNLALQDMNIKLEGRNTYFIQKKGKFSKLYNFSEDNEFGEIQFVSDLNPPENYEISFNFMTNLDGQYEIKYKKGQYKNCCFYLFGNSLTEDTGFVYKYEADELQMFYRFENFSNDPMFATYEKFGENTIHFYVNECFEDGTTIYQMRYEDGNQLEVQSQFFKGKINLNFSNYQATKFTNRKISGNEFKYINVNQESLFYGKINELSRAYLDENFKSDQALQQRVGNVLERLKHKPFFLLDSKTIVIIENNYLEILTFEEQTPKRVDKTWINKGIFFSPSFLVKDKLRVIYTQNSVQIEDVFFQFKDSFMPIYLDGRFYLIKLHDSKRLKKLPLLSMHISGQDITFIFQFDRQGIKNFGLFKRTIQEVKNLNDDYLIKDERDYINLNEIFGQGNTYDDFNFQYFNDLLYQPDSFITFIARRNFENRMQTKFCRLDVLKLTQQVIQKLNLPDQDEEVTVEVKDPDCISKLFQPFEEQFQQDTDELQDLFIFFEIDNCFGLDKGDLIFQQSSIVESITHKKESYNYQIICPIDADGQIKKENFKQIQIFQFQIKEKTLAHVKSFQVNTDTDLLEKDQDIPLYYNKYQNCIIPQWDHKSGLTVGTQLYYHFNDGNENILLQLRKTKQNRLRNKLISAYNNIFLKEDENPNKSYQIYIQAVTYKYKQTNAFTQRETFVILNQGLKNLLTMKQLSFEDLDEYIVYDPKKRNQTSLQPRLFLTGLNLISNRIEQQLKQKKELENKPLKIDFFNSLIEKENQFIPGQSLLDQLAHKNDIAKMHKVNPFFDFQYDFFKNSLISSCLNTGIQKIIQQADEIVQFLIEKEFDIPLQHQIIMQALPYLIETKSINIKNFLDPMDEDQAYRNVTLEQFVSDRLPARGSKQSSYFDIEMQLQQDIHKEVIDRLRKENFYSQEDEQIEFSFVNFFFTTLQMKISRIYNMDSGAAKFVFNQNVKIKEINLNELLIARLLNERQEEDKDFLEYKSIQKLIGRQFQLYSQRGTQKSFWIYLILFVAPYFISVALRDQYDYDFSDRFTPFVVLQVCRALSVGTQVYFFILECKEMAMGLSEYFSTVLNFAEIGQFFIFIAHIVMDAIIISANELSSEELIIVNSYVEVIIVIFVMIKLLNLLSSLSQYQMLVILINQVFLAIIPLLIVTLKFMIEFSVMLLAAKGAYQYDQDDNNLSKEYPNFPPFVQALYTTYRFSVGDQRSVKWRQADENVWSVANGFQSALVWFIFFLIQLVLQIIILNFLIAQISDLYEKIKSGLHYFYQYLVEQNMTYLFREQTSYNQIWIMQTPVLYLPSNVDEEEFQTVSTKIRKFQKEQTELLADKMNELETKITTIKTDLFAKLSANQEHMKANQETMKQNQEAMKETLNSILSKLGGR